MNANPEEQFDIALYSEFDTMDDVRAYAAHPAHLAVAALLKVAKKAVRVWIMNVRRNRSTVLWYGVALFLCGGTAFMML